MRSKVTRTNDQRKSERRVVAERRTTPPERAVTGDRREVEKRGMAASMVDALEDILQYERASERSIRVAANSN